MSYSGICAMCLKRVKCKLEWKVEMQESLVQATYCEEFKPDIKVIKKEYPKVYRKIQNENKRKVE